MQRTVHVLRDARRVTPTTRFVSVSLHEPPKELVHAGAVGERRVFAVLFDNAANAYHEATVSLDAGSVKSWQHVPGVQPTMTVDEQIEREAAVLASAEFRDALKRYYGVDDASLVMVDIWSAGNYGSEEDRSQGVARPGDVPKHGALVAEQLYAPNHQHFFNVRLDFDLDGVANTVQRVDVVADDPGAPNDFGNAFHARVIPLVHEAGAKGNLCLETARTWKIINPARRNAVGQPVGYQFLPGDNSVPFASPDAW